MQFSSIFVPKSNVPQKYDSTAGITHPFFVLAKTRRVLGEEYPGSGWAGGACPAADKRPKSKSLIRGERDTLIRP